MIKKLLTTFLVGILSLSIYGQTADVKVKEKNVDVIVGIDKIMHLDFQPALRNAVQIGNESILDHVLISRPKKSQVTLKGLKSGKTSVTIRNKFGDIKARYLVNITATDQSKIVQELRELIGDIEGIEIGIKGNQVYVGGNIVVPSDIGRVVVVLDRYQDVLRLVELSPQTQLIIARKMQEEIQKNGMRDVTVRVVNGLFWLEGLVTQKGQRQRAYDIAAAYVPDRIESLARRVDAVQSAKRPIIVNFVVENEKKKPASVPKMIKITAQFVELTKDYNKIFGFRWEPTIAGDGGSINIGKSSSGGVTTGSSGNSLAATISNLFPKLASAKNAGFARVVQSGVVITKDKVAGKINKQTTKPFSLGSGEFTRSNSATAGFDMSVKPSILPGEKIDLEMGVNVSANIGDPPETTSNSISTSLIVKSKESAVVGGIVISKSSTDYDRNPSQTDEVEGGSTLFSFVRSKTYSTTRNQFVIFVTPEVIESASSGTDEIKRKFRKRRR